MMAVLEDGVFGPGADTLSLLSLFQMALEGRHRIALHDEAGPLYREWRGQQGRIVQEEIDEALSRSTEAARAPSKITVRVCAAPKSDWSARPRRLTVPDALSLLNRPFWLLLENWESDYRFLLAACETEARAWIQGREQRGWLERHNGGGLTDMHKRVVDMKRTDEQRCLTVWVLFDSDARAPGKPSPASKDLFGACGVRVPCHQLKRRAIENYAPKRALEAWARRSGDVAMIRRAEAFFAMKDDEQRHHFAMKGGLKEDAASALGINEDLYGEARLPAELRKHLVLGFGSKLREVFADEEIGVTQADMMRDEECRKELTAALSALLGWIR